MKKNYVNHEHFNNYKKVEGDLIKQSNVVFSTYFDALSELLTETHFCGDLWCDIQKGSQFQSDNKSTTVRCWYKSHTPVFVLRSSAPDLIFEVIALDDGPEIEWVLWFDDRLLTWNKELKNELAIRRLKGDNIVQEQRLWSL